MGIVENEECTVVGVVGWSIKGTALQEVRDTGSFLSFKGGGKWDI
jgi:hypothetical protein